MANEFKIKNGLVVSGSADVEQNLTVNGILTAKQYNVSLISSSILFESGSTQLGNSLDDTHLFTGSIKVTGSITLNGQPIGTGKLDETTFENYTSSTDSRLGLLENSTGSIRNDFNSFTSSYTNVSGSLDSRLDTLETLSGSFTGSFSGSFVGDGTNLYNIPASGVTGLNLTQIADGSVTASVSNTNGLRVNSKSEITGSLIVTNGITGSIDYSNITNKPTLVSGSVQIEITGTTGYSTFSSSVSSSIGSLSSSIATTTNDLDGRLDTVETSTGSLNSFTSSINTTIKNKLNTDGVISGSLQVNLPDVTGYSTFSSSITTTDSNQNTRLGNLETSTGSLNSFTSSALTRVSAIEISTGSLNSFTSSIDTTIKTKLNSENVISGSIQVNITGTTGYSTFSSSISSSIGDLSSSVATTTNNLSSSIATTDLNQSNRIGNLEVSTGSLNSFTSSIDTTIKNKLNSDGVISGSSQVTLSSTTGYSTFSSSIATTDLNQSNRLDLIETSTGSLNSFTSSINTTIKNRLNSENVLSGSSQVLNGSGVWSGSAQLPSGIVSGSSQLPSGLVSGSSQILNGTTIHSGTFFNGITVVSGSSQISYTGITDIPSGLVSGSSQVLLSSGIWSGSAQLPNGVVSGSSQVDITSTTNYTSFSSSIATTDLNQNNRLDSIETKTGSYATTGSNIFKSNQTISGSVIITENLTVFGSSSITYVTSSQLRVDDNIITVNTASPGSRFGGLEVHDSGSVGIATGSILWDSVNNRWIYQQSSEATYGGGMLLSGPRSSGSLGSELSLTSGRIARSAGGDHLNDSIITEYSGTTIGISGSLDITGSLKVSNGITLPIDTGIGFGNNSTIFYDSESGEFFFRTLGNNIYLGTVDSSIGITNDDVYLSAYSSVNIAADASNGLGTEQLRLSNGTNTGLVVQPSGNITFATVSDDLVNKVQIKGSTYISSSLVIGKTSANAKLDVNGDALVTGSITATGTIRGTNITAIETATGSLNSFTSSINTTIKNKLNSDGVISGSSQISFGMISAIPSGLVSGSSQVLLSSGVWSGSAQLPAGTVSGSSQVLLGSGVWSGSAQLPSGVVSGSSQITYSGISGIPSGIISGSSQVSFGSISGVPSGLVSGSSQVLLGSGVWSGSAQLPSGVVSGSSQVLSGTGIWSGSAQLPSGVISGSAQTIANLPSGTVSGSSQITLTSGQVTTGLGYTPYNATNPSGYITSYSETDTLATVTARGATTGVDTIYTGGLKTRKSQTAGDYTTAALWVESHSNTATGIAFHISGVKGTYLEMRTNQVLYWDGNTVYHSGNLTNNNQLTNGAGYITGINSSAVTTALGFTPYNATNPSGYISSITSGNVTTALGYTPYNATNPNGYITSSATSLSLTGNLTVSSGNSTGGGIILADDGDIVDLNDAYLSLRFSSGVRIYSANRGGSAVITLGNTGVVTATTFSGALSGNATTATTAGALSSMNISQFTNNSGYLTSISSGNVTTALGYTPYNATNPNGYITGISFANVSSKPTTISGYGITDAITTGNIGSQSVNYANSAGSAPNASNANAYYNVTPGEGYGLKFWSSDSYKISMGASSVYLYGPVTDYSIKTQMDAGSPGRGFTWGREGVVPIAGLNGTSGNMQIAGTFTTGGSILPLSNNSVNLGSVSLGWANVYTNDLHLSNMNKPEGNDIDGTKGTWTIQEGAENLYIINNNNGKKFKINLEEII